MLMEHSSIGYTILERQVTVFQTKFTNNTATNEITEEAFIC